MTEEPQKPPEETSAIDYHLRAFIELTNILSTHGRNTTDDQLADVIDRCAVAFKVLPTADRLEMLEHFVLTILGMGVRLARSAHELESAAKATPAVEPQPA